MPIIFIGISITVFFVFSDPLYKSISELRAQVASYDQALDNSKSLENERDKLTVKKNSIDPTNLAKLQKLLPENIDNIRLILEIEQIAAPYGMVLKDIKYSPSQTSGTAAPVPATGTIQGGGVTAKVENKDYGIWDLEFSTTGTYNNFLNFTKDIESNLRIVDISSVQFSSPTTTTTTGVGAGSVSSELYKYSFKIKTYWLKN